MQGSREPGLGSGTRESGYKAVGYRYKAKARSVAGSGQMASSSWQAEHNNEA